MRLHAPQWSLVVLAGVLALAGFCLYVYYVNAQALARRYAIVPVDLSAATGAEAVARGKHLADVTGCTDCHRADLRGGLFGEDDWLSGRYYASNLTLKARGYSDRDLARIVRTGVRPDGRGVQAMPSFGFVRLTDAEMADVLAFLRSLPVGGSEQPAHFIGPLDQWHLWRGDFRAAAAYVAEEQAKVPAESVSSTLRRGISRASSAPSATAATSRGMAGTAEPRISSWPRPTRCPSSCAYCAREWARTARSMGS